MISERANDRSNEFVLIVVVVLLDEFVPTLSLLPEALPCSPSPEISQLTSYIRTFISNNLHPSIDRKTAVSWIIGPHYHHHLPTPSLSTCPNGEKPVPPPLQDSWPTSLYLKLCPKTARLLSNGIRYDVGGVRDEDACPMAKRAFPHG